ncbi:dicarboxylic amino acid permease [Xylariaceae sp. FL1019]|nr:dicarboxylic amino acid permease [Xylariaceae sp. FL1019]
MDHHTRSTDSSAHDHKEPLGFQDVGFENQHIRGLETSAETSLHRGLKARHISMIAIGGAIGTGLLIGTGSALAHGGPASILISYSVIGFVVFLVMAGLGEMAAWLPMSAGFTGYATRFCDPSLGFALGWTYWLKYIILPANQLTAATLVIRYWLSPERVNPGVWVAILLVLIIAINYFGVRFFGEFEFWLSSFKVVVIVGVIFVTLIISAGGGPDHHARGFEYWRNPGGFAPYLIGGSATSGSATSQVPLWDFVGNKSLAQFIGFYSTLVNAVFAFLGTELVGVTVGEAQNPRKTIPRAIKLTFFRIVFFYVIAIFLVGMCVPYTLKDLTSSSIANAAASPFVAAIKQAGIPVLDHILNASLLLFVFSAANSDLYIASRTLYGLASDGSAPSIFRKTDSRGVPIYALGLSSVFGLLAFLSVNEDSRKVFTYFVNVVTILGLMAWISILVTHIWFVRARKAQNLTNDAMPYTAPFGIWGSYVALAICILVAITKNFDAFIPSPGYGVFEEKAKYEAFITGYIGIPVYLALIFGHKIFTKSKGVRPHECDFYTGKDVIDREEEEFLAMKASEKAAHPDKGRSFYNRYVSWLF